MLQKFLRILPPRRRGREFDAVLPAVFLLVAGTALAHVLPLPDRAPGGSVRMRANFEVVAPESAPLARGLGIRSRAYADASPIEFRPSESPARRRSNSGSLLRLRQGRIVMLTAYGEMRLDRPPANDLPDTDPLAASRPAVTLFVSRPGASPANAAFLECPATPAKLGNLRLLAVRLGVTPEMFSAPLNAGHYRALVDAYALKYNLSPALVLAIMRTESNFNPFAVSNSGAQGLMQVVPDTAGGEVYTFLNGQAGIPDTGLLFDPEHNIKYGTTYLHLLERRYFGNVLNTAAREMCIIAAYNGGPGAVLRVFDQDMNTAVAIINSLTPEEVYEALTTRMPREESRRYVDVVLGRLRGFDG